MRYGWEGVHAALVQSVITLQAEQEFRMVGTNERDLARFESPSALISYLTDPAGDLDEKDRIYAALVRLIQRRAEFSELATSVIWLGLWPGLDAIYRRNLRFGSGQEGLISEIGERFTAAVGRAELSRINRVAATLVRNTERDLIKGRRSESVRDSREVVLPDERVLADLAEPEPPQPEMEEIRTRLRPIAGSDTDLLVRVLVLGETQREAAEHLGISHGAARKRFGRAIDRVREHFSRGPVPFHLADLRFPNEGLKQPERGRRR